MTNSSREPHSPNFAFLSKHDAVLVRHAALAERYVFDDPNAALVKLRQFGELLARHAAAYSGITIEDRDSQADVLEKLWSAAVLGPETSQLFHGLRKAGNIAAHGALNDRGEALHQLRMARTLAVWFHKAFGGDPRFRPGAFTPPPDPQAAEQELRAELDRLREELVAARDQAAGATSTAAQHAQRLRDAEAEAKNAFEELEVALELAAETEQRLAAERADYETRLAALQQQSASAPAAERDRVVRQARQESEQVDLDEAATRRIIDAQLREAGWEADTGSLRYDRGVRPVKGRNLAIAEWPTDHGPADYVLFSGTTPLAVVEAKRQRKDVAAAIEQSKRYSRGFRFENGFASPGGPWGQSAIPFLFATNGRPYLRQIAEKSGVWFLDVRRTANHPRALESWYTPEGLTQLHEQDLDAAEQRLAAEPTDYLPLRDYQADAVRAVEAAITAGRRELLVAMATGTGKTVTCIGLVYRLIKSRRFRRVLFLVDRTALGEQSTDAFRHVRLEGHQTFADVYDVKQLGDLAPDPDTRLHVATVQGIVKRLLDPADDTPPVPVDWYDCVIIDECHRGYNLDREMSDKELEFRSEADYISKYRRVLDHFDAVRIGLTATPALHTTEIFGPPIFEYSYRRAVIDGWLVDHEPPYRLVTKLGEGGMTWKPGEEMKVYEPRTGQLELFNTPDEVTVEVEAFNRTVVTENFNRALCSALVDYIDPDLPGKALAYCVNDLHADLFVRLLKEAFDERYGSVPDDAVLKITAASDKPLQLIRRFKNERLPKVAVTVDLLTTGIDVPEITDLIFVRRVKSRILFEQMLGRATRLCRDLDGPGQDKQQFHIFDAVDIYRDLQKLTDMRPVVTRPNISFGQLATELQTVADEEFRRQVQEQFLAKLRRKRLSETQEQRLHAATGGMGREDLAAFVRKTDPKALAAWFAEHPDVADILDDVFRRGVRLIVSEHEDEMRRVERGYGTAKRPEDYLESFRRYVTTHFNDIPALVVVAQRPRDLTRSQLRELRLALDEAGFSEANLRTAWRETTNQDVAASILGYVRHVACGEPLVSHADRVRAAMAKILAGRAWTDPQRRWLERIGKQLEQELVVDREALDAGQFRQQGGFARLNKVFDGELDAILRDIADAVWQVAA